MVLDIKDKNQAEALLARGFIQVGDKSAITQVWKD